MKMNKLIVTTICALMSFTSCHLIAGGRTAEQILEALETSPLILNNKKVTKELMEHIIQKDDEDNQIIEAFKQFTHKFDNKEYVGTDSHGIIGKLLDYLGDVYNDDQSLQNDKFKRLYKHIGVVEELEKALGIVSEQDAEPLSTCVDTINDLLINFSDIVQQELLALAQKAQPQRLNEFLTEWQTSEKYQKAMMTTQNNYVALMFRDAIEKGAYDKLRPFFEADKKYIFIAASQADTPEQRLGIMKAAASNEASENNPVTTNQTLMENVCNAFNLIGERPEYDTRSNDGTKDTEYRNILEYLKECGWLNLKDSEGDTFLHFFARHDTRTFPAGKKVEYRCVPVATYYLLEASLDPKIGLNINEMNKYGNTAFNISILRHEGAIVNLFCHHFVTHNIPVQESDLTSLKSELNDGDTPPAFLTRCKENAEKLLARVAKTDDQKGKDKDPEKPPVDINDNKGNKPNTTPLENKDTNNQPVPDTKWNAATMGVAFTVGATTLIAAGLVFKNWYSTRKWQKAVNNLTQAYEKYKVTRNADQYHKEKQGILAQFNDEQQMALITQAVVE